MLELKLRTYLKRDQNFEVENRYSRKKAQKAQSYSVLHAIKSLQRFWHVCVFLCDSVAKYLSYFPDQTCGPPAAENL